MFRDKRGFTLIELVLVITILGILAVAALPVFQNLTGNARRSSRDGVVGAVRSAINMVYSQNIANGMAPAAAWPTTGTLDAAATAVGDCTPANSCFLGRPAAAGASPGPILQQGITDGAGGAGAGTGWEKTGADVWTHNDGVTLCTYTYAPAGGTLTGAPAANCP